MIVIKRRRTDSNKRYALVPLGFITNHFFFHFTLFPVIPNWRNGTKILQGGKCFKRRMNYSRDNFARKKHCYTVFLTDDSISWNTRFIDKLRETRRRKEITKRSRAPQDRPVFCVVTKTYRHLECSRSI